MLERTVGGFKFEINDEKVKEVVDHLWAYVDAMMPAQFYNQELRQKAVNDMAWVVGDIQIAGDDHEKVA